MARKRDIVARVGADTSEFDSKMGSTGLTLDKLGDLDYGTRTAASGSSNG